MVVSIPTKVSMPRRSTRVAADVLIEVQAERFAYAGETITVNLHGALVRVAGPLKHGDRVRIHVHCTGGFNDILSGLYWRTCTDNMDWIDQSGGGALILWSRVARSIAMRCGYYFPSQEDEQYRAL